MKKSIIAGCVLAATAVVGLAAPAQASQPQATHKVAYCHATHSETNPYVFIETDKLAVVKAHQNHQDDEDIIPAFTYQFRGETHFFPGQNTRAIALEDCSGGGVYES